MCPRSLALEYLCLADHRTLLGKKLHFCFSVKRQTSSSWTRIIAARVIIFNTFESDQVLLHSQIPRVSSFSVKPESQLKWPPCYGALVLPECLSCSLCFLPFSLLAVCFAHMSGSSLLEASQALPPRPSVPISSLCQIVKLLMYPKGLWQHVARTRPSNRCWMEFTKDSMCLPLWYSLHVSWGCHEQKSMVLFQSPQSPRL